MHSVSHFCGKAILIINRYFLTIDKTFTSESKDCVRILDLKVLRNWDVTNIVDDYAKQGFVRRFRAKNFAVR